MDSDSFSASLFKWDPRLPLPSSPPPFPSLRDLTGGLEELFQAYGIRYFTAAKIAELGFTVDTLLDMKDEELDEMMNSLSNIFRFDLLVGERYGVKAALRAERRRIDDEEARRRHLMSNDTAARVLDAMSQDGFSDELLHQGSGRGTWEMAASGGHKTQRRKKNCKARTRGVDEDNDDTEGEEGNGGGRERQREHPFIVTVPGEVARGKKNGLDYLFHLYEQCHEFLIQVQNIAKERGEKCPTKVTNQVFRYAQKVGATYINKPKMRHYVHCYALHCLDKETSNVLRRAYKEQGENVGSWRQACYQPVVAIAGYQGWDIDAIFNAHPKLSVCLDVVGVKKQRVFGQGILSTSITSKKQYVPTSSSLTQNDVQSLKDGLLEEMQEQVKEKLKEEMKAELAENSELMKAELMKTILEEMRRAPPS